MNEDQEPMQAGVEPVVVEVPPAEDEEAARKRAREFDDALYAPLLSRAHSDQARALVDAVTALVAQQELEANARTRRRGKARYPHGELWHMVSNTGYARALAAAWGGQRHAKTVRNVLARA